MAHFTRHQSTWRGQIPTFGFWAFRLKRGLSGYDDKAGINRFDEVARQTDVAKQRAIDRLSPISWIEALVDAGMTKSVAVTAGAGLGDARVASIWSWLASIAGFSRHERLAYLVLRFTGGGRPAATEMRLHDHLAADYVRPRVTDLDRVRATGEGVG